MTGIKKYLRRHDREANAKELESGHSIPRRGAAFSKLAYQIRAGLLPGMLGGVLLIGSASAAKQSTPVTNAKPPAGAVNAFQEQAGKLGVRRCANLFAALGQSATNGSTYAVQVQANQAAPDAHVVAGVAGITYDTPQYKGQAAGIALAAPVGQSCEGQMVRVAPFQQPCPAMLTQLPSGSTVAANLSGVPLYNLGGNQGQALLLTSGATCVVVTIGPVAEAR